MTAYNQYSLNKIKELISKGKKFSGNYETEQEMIWNEDLSLSEMEFVSIGFNFPEYEVPEIKEYYRIGEPISEDDCYRNSFNFMDDKREKGLSVVTRDWLDSFKGIFFGTSDEKIAQKGVYKIKGFALPYKGGDDELLICPMDWAEKTDITTREDLYNIV